MHTSQLHLNMQCEHFTPLGIHMNGSGKDRTIGLLTWKIMELLTIHRLGDPHHPSLGGCNHRGRGEKTKPAVEESNFTSPGLRVTDEQGIHSTNVNL